MADLLVSCTQRVLDFVDQRISLFRAVLITQLLHIIYCCAVADSSLHSDSFCHFSWMRITHRKPMSEWYDNPDYTHLDYPPLAAYVHYLLGMIVQKFDPKYFFESPITGFLELTGMAKLGLRVAVVLANTLTYNICLIYVILEYYKDKKTSLKMFMIILFQFFTYYAPIDFGDCQINGMHYALLLLALHKMTQHNFSLATFFLTLSALYKHTAVIYSLPMGVYIIHITLQDAEKLHKTAVGKFMYFAKKCFIYAFIGIFTILAVISPFLQYPEELKTMFHVLFYERGFIDTTPTFWHTLHFFKDTYITGETVSLFITSTRAIMIISLIAIWKCLRSHPRLRFEVAYVAFTWVFFLFGYPIHTKHIAYTFLGLVFTLPTFSEYFTLLNVTLSLTMFSQSCRLANEYAILVHSVLFCLASWIFEEYIVSSQAACDPLEIAERKDPAAEQPVAKTMWVKLHNIFKDFRRTFTLMAFMMTFTFFITYQIITRWHRYRCIPHYYPVEDVGFVSGFFALLIPFTYSCLSLKVY